jgi:2-oxoglutarate dehydrogenase complex dehydrogenase (E1) component-like enzyme
MYKPIRKHTAVTELYARRLIDQGVISEAEGMTA